MTEDGQPKPGSEAPKGDESAGADSAPGQPDEPVDQSSGVPNYSLSPRRVGMFAVAVASASLTALVVVTSVEGVDALTTIALVLAIVAFTIQIFLFVVQSQASSEQRVRSEQLNTQTRALLAEVRATAQATQAMVSQQFNQLLQAFVTGAAQTAQETKFDPVSFEQRLLSNIRAQVPTTAGPSGPRVAAAVDPESRGEGASVQPRVIREQAAVRRRARNERPNRLKTFPSEEEGKTAVDEVRKLVPADRRRLRDLGQDEVNATDRGWFVGLIPTLEDKSLEDHHLASPARVDTGEGPSVVTRLTDNGVQAARLLTALGDIPSWARDLIVEEEEGAQASSGDDDIPF
jgi:hypothetical protein